MCVRFSTYFDRICIISHWKFNGIAENGSNVRRIVSKKRQHSNDSAAVIGRICANPNCFQKKTHSNEKTNFVVLC